MRLLYNRVAVEEIVIKRNEEGKIMLPESAQPKENLGRVVAVGDGTRTQNGDLIPLTVRVGDQVLFERQNSVATTLKGKKVLIMGEGSIIAILGE